MHNLSKLAVAVVVGGLWTATAMAQTTANPPNTGSSASGQSGSGVTPRTTGGSAMPTSKEDGIKLRRKGAPAAAPAAAGTTMGDSSASGSTTTTTTTASAAPARKPKRDRN